MCDREGAVRRHLGAHPVNLNGGPYGHQEHRAKTGPLTLLIKKSTKFTDRYPRHNLIRIIRRYARRLGFYRLGVPRLGRSLCSLCGWIEIKPFPCLRQR